MMPKEDVLSDMEDLLTTPKPSVCKPKTGRQLFRRIRRQLARHVDAGHGMRQSAMTPDKVQSASAISPSTDLTAVHYTIPDAGRLTLVPVDCLSTCNRGNVVALSAPGKYTYQFGDLDETSPEQLQDLLTFTEQWMASPDGFSKSATRPKRMRGNILSRIPPLPLPPEHN